MKVSVTLTNHSFATRPIALRDRFAAVARAVDERPFDTLWLPDHLLQVDPNASIDEPLLESYTTLGWLAAITTDVRLGTMVGWASIRPPAVLVKAVTTLDVLSGGRAWLGVGAGYHAEEARLMGLPFPPTAARFDDLDDILNLAIRMWTDDQTPLRGKRHQFDGPRCRPAPVTTDGPRILIGGMGETRTLPLVARFGDACNLFDVPDDGATIRHKLDVLAKLCAREGRDATEIEVTVSTRLADDDTAHGFAARARRLASFGVQHVVVLTNGPWSDARLDVLAAAAEMLIAA